MQHNTTSASLKKQAADLAERVLADISFYKHFGLGFSTCNIFSVPPGGSVHIEPSLPVQPPVKSEPAASSGTQNCSKWAQVVKAIRRKKMKENKAAFLIQSIWRAKEGMIDPPELGQFFALTFGDWQEAEIKALQSLPDGTLGRKYQEALQAEEEEEEEDGAN